MKLLNQIMRFGIMNLDGYDDHEQFLTFDYNHKLKL